ncbi:acyltransferase [Synechococcus sp. CBW1006]|uniref:acyltransferase family protein n=1 Tax=Synechococcus sp. CBW1006 TaxID=1353138 RepID=UPI0018CED151|nr:acyltransferase [Synechococcus sp. CBW1006]QPN65941.1 acyltransferase [Synechococcus sp. CBW1006]
MYSLQYLRGVASLSIVLYHAEAGLNVYRRNDFQLSLFSWGSAAVPLFFVLSGFVVALAGDQRPRPALVFIYSRFARLYPAYLLVASLFITALAVLPRSLFNQPLPINMAGIAKTLFFEYGQISGYVYVGWVLFYEVCFYLAFSLVIARFRQISCASWFHYLISMGLLFAAVSGLVVPGYFLAGLAAFLLLRSAESRSLLSVGPLALTLCVIVNGFRSPLSLICFGIVVGLVLLECGAFAPNLFRRPNKFLLALGDSSYSIYLVQVLTVSACLKLSRAALLAFAPGLPLSNSYLLYWFTVVGLSLLTTVLAGLWMRRYIEKPSFLWLMQWLPAGLPG